MLAVSALEANPTDPLRGLAVHERSAPHPPPGWGVVTVRAAALNHHDLWTLRGVGTSRLRLPVVLGVEASGVDAEGREVIVYPVVGDPAAGGGDETLDPAMGVLGGEHDGTFAEQLVVPLRNLVPKPACLSHEEAACLPGAWLTAYRMLVEKAEPAPGTTMLVQGAGGGVSTALFVLGRAAGLRVWVTSRSARRRAASVRLGAHAAFEPGARLPEQVDVVMDSVGAATWDHSLQVVRPGGRIVTCGATTGAVVPTNLAKVFYRQVTVSGATLGTRHQLERLARFCAAAGVRPVIHDVLPLRRARHGFAAMSSGEAFGKVVFQVTGG